MKANAPEKIYMSNYSSELTYNWHPERLAVKDIEYTRTDAFIEKVYEYLNKTCRRFILTEKDIEDFKNYMKGE